MNRISIIVAYCVIFVRCISAEEVKAVTWVDATQLLSDSAQGFIEIRSFPEFTETFSKTGFGRLLETDKMQPFQKSVSLAFDEWLARRGGSFAVRFSDLGEIASGEVVIAWLKAEETRHPYRICLMVDTRGNEKAVQSLLERVSGDLKKQGSKELVAKVQGLDVTTYTLPRKPGRLDTDEVAYGRFDGRLLVADRADVIGELFTACKTGTASRSLLATAEYGQLKKQLGDSSKCQLRWFAKPMGMARIIRDRMRQGEIPTEDVIGLLERQGFDQLKAASGELAFMGNSHDLVHRAFIYAPTPKAQEERFRSAAKMLEFPNTPIAPLPPWLNIEAASVLRLNWKMHTAFWALEPLVDDIGGEAMFRDTLAGIIKDLDVDVAKDIVSNLGDQLWMITDNTQPSQLTSERTLVAIPLKNANTVQRVISKWLNDDPDMKQIAHPTLEIFEIQHREDDEEEKRLRNFGFGGQTQQQASEPLLEKWAVCVFQEHLLISSHASLIVDVVNGKSAAREKTAQLETPVLEVLQTVSSATEGALVRWTLPEVAWRVKYDLLKQGKLKDSTSVLASLFRRASEEIEKTIKKGDRNADKLKVKGEELPEFQFTAPYLGKMGSIVEATPDGWQMTNVILTPANAN